MKKTIVSILFLLSVSLLAAQDGVFKQSAGEKSLELLFDPGAIFNASNNNTILNRGLGVRLRLFASESLAYRLNVNISYDNSSEVTQDADDFGNEELKLKQSELGVFLRPGFEKHFAGTKRLSPYIGAELNLGYHTSKIKDEYQAGTEVYVIETKNDQAGDGITLGIAAVAGADFYIAKKLYLGVELNYGLNYFMASKTKVSNSAPGVDDVESKQGKINGLTFQPNALGIFRIGFLFGKGSSNSVSIDEF